MRIDDLRMEFSRTDSKAATLLGLATGTLALIVALGVGDRPLELPVRVLIWASALPVAVSITLLLSLLRPRPGWVSSWGGAEAPLTALQFIERAQALPTSPSVSAMRLAEISHLIHSKYRLLQRATDGLTVSLAMFGVTGVVALLA